jgi:hypothetical protein
MLAEVLRDDPTMSFCKSYDGGLLRLAIDLGTRLLPAFVTPTGIPYNRVRCCNQPTTTTTTTTLGLTN